MSRRYEYAGPDTPVAVVPPDAGEDCGLDMDDGHHALVIGDPWASAFAVEGSPEDLRAFTARVAKVVENGLPRPASPASDDQLAAWLEAACPGGPDSPGYVIRTLDDLGDLISQAAAMLEDHAATHLIRDITMWPLGPETALITIDRPSRPQLWALAARQSFDGLTRREALAAILAIARAEIGRLPAAAAGPALPAAFGLDEAKARAFLLRALRRHAGGPGTGQGDGAGPDESWELDPGWDLEKIYTDEIRHVEDLVDQAISQAGAITCTMPDMSIALAIDAPADGDWMYQWQVSLPGHAGFALCSPLWRSFRALGWDAEDGTSGKGSRAALGILREAVTSANQLLASAAAAAALPARPPGGPMPGREYQGHVRYADGTVVSLQCYDGDHGQCPDTTAPGEDRDSGPLDGYLCECGCPGHPDAGPGPRPEPVTARFFGAEIRWYPANRDEGDHSDMYVIDALGLSTLIRRRAGDTYVHVDTQETAERPRLPLAIEVNNGGEATYG